MKRVRVQIINYYFAIVYPTPVAHENIYRGRGSNLQTYRHRRRANLYIYIHVGRI